MANISTLLQKILDAVYGEEVRGSIHDALAAMNEESNSAMQFASKAKDSATEMAAQAKSSASEAGEKASQSAASAAAAKASENNAKASENVASQKASEAGGHASRAAESENAAANSETVATQKAADAGASADAAASSESNVKLAEERVRSLRSEVETLSAQTTSDKEAADKAREQAEAARDAAGLSRNAAKGSEDNAKRSADAAETAKNDAEAAKNSAQADAEAAEESRKAADDAKASAEQFSEDAGSSADAASKSAEKAQQYSGKPPKVDEETKTWWIWDAESGEYYDTHMTSEIPGPQGVGISDIKLTSGDHSPGTTDIYTVTLTNGTSYNITVWNGRNGEGAGDVLGISFDLVIPHDSWAEGSVTVSDEKLVASGAYKYFIDSDESCEDEYRDCGVRAKNITTSGYITFVNDSDPGINLTVNVLRLELGANKEA